MEPARGKGNAHVDLLEGSECEFARFVSGVSPEAYGECGHSTHTDPCISYFFSSKCYVRLSNFTFAIQFPQIHVA